MWIWNFCLDSWLTWSYRLVGFIRYIFFSVFFDIFDFFWILRLGKLFFLVVVDFLEENMFLLDFIWGLYFLVIVFVVVFIWVDSFIFNFVFFLGFDFLVAWRFDIMWMCGLVGLLIVVFSDGWCLWKIWMVGLVGSFLFFRFIFFFFCSLDLVFFNFFVLMLLKWEN